MKERIYQRWSSSSLLEKRLILGLGGGIIILLMSMVIVKSLMDYSWEAQQRRIKATQDLIWITQHKSAVMALFDNRTQDNPAHDFDEYIENIFMQNSITAVTEDKGAEKMLVEIDSVRLDLLLEIIVRMQQERSIIVSRLKLVALSEQDELVKVTQLLLEMKEH